jgi:hypothetical protein
MGYTLCGYCCIANIYIFNELLLTSYQEKFLIFAPALVFV